MEIGAAKIGARAVTQKAGGQPGTGKQGPSKFDSIRADLRQQLLDRAKLPPKISELAPQQKQMLENDLRRRLDQAAAPASPNDLFKGEVSKARTALDGVSQAVARIPQHEAFSPIRERLKSIEKDFAATSKAISNPKGLDTPQALLDMQQKLYTVTQNIEVLSEVVNQVDSGIKNVMQTQV